MVITKGDVRGRELNNSNIFVRAITKKNNETVNDEYQAHRKQEVK